MLNEVLTWITILGCALSIISLVICLYVFTFVRGRFVIGIQLLDSFILNKIT